jgi:hypothetical protein
LTEPNPPAGSSIDWAGPPLGRGCRPRRIPGRDIVGGIIARYRSLEAFFARLRAGLDDEPTIGPPVIVTLRDTPIA